MRRIILCVLCVGLLSACGTKQEEPVETTPQYLADRSCVFDMYADEAVLNLEDDENFKSIDETSCTVVKDGSEVNVMYIEGNSLNDFPKAVHNSLEATDVSDLKNNSFSADGVYYTFKKSVSNDYVMVSGNVDDKAYISEICSRINMEEADDEES